MPKLRQLWPVLAYSAAKWSMVLSGLLMLSGLTDAGPGELVWP
jgi:hypothetical protein